MMADDTPGSSGGGIVIAACPKCIMDTRYGTRDFWESVVVLTDGNVAMKRLELRCQFVRHLCLHS